MSWNGRLPEATDIAARGLIRNGARCLCGGHAYGLIRCDQPCDITAEFDAERALIRRCDHHPSR